MTTPTLADRVKAELPCDCPPLEVPRVNRGDHWTTCLSHLQPRILALVERECDALRASLESLIDVIAQESHAVGISETMTPAERVYEMRVQLDAQRGYNDQAGATITALRARVAVLERVATAARKAWGMAAFHDQNYGLSDALAALDDYEVK